MRTATPKKGWCGDFEKILSKCTFDIHTCSIDGVANSNNLKAFSVPSSVVNK